MDSDQARAEALARARSVSKESVAPLAVETDRERRFPRRQIEALGKTGLLGLTVSREHGGMGQGFSAMAEVVEEIAASCASTAMVYVMHLCGLATVSAKPTSARAAEVLRPSAAGRHLTTLAFSERGSGGHFYAPVSRPERRNDEFVLSAEKSFVTSAGEADSYLVSSLRAGARGPLESNIYLVRKNAPGLKASGRWEGLGMRGNASAPMSLQAVRIPASDLLGEEGEGLDLMLKHVVPSFHIGIAAVSLGIARSALSGAIGHAGARKYEHTGGSALASLPAVQYAVAEASLELDLARALLLRTAAGLDSGAADLLVPLLEVKLAANRAAQEVAARAMKVCGGAAFGGHSAVERAFRDAQAGSVMAPASDVLKEFIGKALLGLPLF